MATRRKRCKRCRRSLAVTDFELLRRGYPARRDVCASCEQRAKRLAYLRDEAKRKAKRKARTAALRTKTSWQKSAAKSNGSSSARVSRAVADDEEVGLRFRAPRCAHGFYAGLCTLVACPHWDHAEDDKDAERTLVHASWGRADQRGRGLSAASDADDEDEELDRDDRRA